jgi:hypothetical protein
MSDFSFWPSKQSDGNKDGAPMRAVTGLDVLRAGLRARIAKGPAASQMARDLAIGTGAIDDFAHGRATLPAPILTAIAKIIFGDSASFDSERNLLVRSKLPSTAMPAGWPPPIPVKPLPTGPIARRPPRPDVPQPPLLAFTGPLSPQ